MAVHREAPKCFKCGKHIHGIYRDESNLPIQLRLIGDSFIRWDYEGHNKICEGVNFIDFIEFHIESQETKDFLDKLNHPRFNRLKGLSEMADFDLTEEQELESKCEIITKYVSEGVFTLEKALDLYNVDKDIYLNHEKEKAEKQSKIDDQG